MDIKPVVVALGPASETQDGYLKKEDFATFDSKANQSTVDSLADEVESANSNIAGLQTDLNNLTGVVDTKASQSQLDNEVNALQDAINEIELTPGPAGTDGKTWYRDAGTPSSGLGVNGDFYLDTSNYEIYQKGAVVAGVWSSIGNIKGADGSNGADGSDALGYGGTSTSTFNPDYYIVDDTLNFTTVEDPLGYVAGNYARLTYASDASVYVEGLITYASPYNYTIQIKSKGTGGEYSNWQLSLFGTPGDVSAAFPSISDDGTTVTIASGVNLGGSGNWRIYSDDTASFKNISRGITKVDPDNGVLSVNDITSVDWINRTLNDESGVTILGWNGGYVTIPSASFTGVTYIGNISPYSGSGTLNDGAYTSVDWVNHSLCDFAGTSVFNYGDFVTEQGADTWWATSNPTSVTEAIRRLAQAVYNNGGMTQIPTL